MTTTRSNAEDRWIDVAATLTEANLDWFMDTAKDLVGDDDSEEFFECCLNLAGV